MNELGGTSSASSVDTSCIDKRACMSKHEKHHDRSYENAYRSGDIGCNLHQSKLQRVEILGMCPHMEKFVACMEVHLESAKQEKNKFSLRIQYSSEECDTRDRYRTRTLLETEPTAW